MGSHILYYITSKKTPWNNSQYSELVLLSVPILMESFWVICPAHTLAVLFKFGSESMNLNYWMLLDRFFFWSQLYLLCNFTRLVVSINLLDINQNVICDISKQFPKSVSFPNFSLLFLNFDSKFYYDRLTLTN